MSEWEGVKGWAWAGGTWFAAVMLGTIEAIFHTLGIPL